MLPSLALAFIAGLLLGSQIPYFPLSTSFGLLVVALVCVALERFALLPVRRVTWCYGLLLTGVVYWTIMVGPAVRDHGTTQVDEVVLDLSGRIVAPVQQSTDRLLMVVKLDEVSPESWSSKHVRLTWRAPERQVFHGDRISFRARLRPPTGSLNPGGFDYVAYLERQGIDAVATVTGPDAIRLLQSGRADEWWAIWNEIDRWRAHIRTAALQTLSQPALGLYLGIVIGDRGYLDGSIRDDFMVTGTIHLLSISGSHLGLVAIVVFVAIRRGLLLLPAAWLLRLSRCMTASRVAALGTIVPVVGYACLAGAELATLRSLIMVLVALVALWLGQEGRIFHALAAAALVLLLHDPQAVYDISFQLSFVSVLAIAVWMVWLRESRTDDDDGTTGLVAYKVWRWFRDAVTMSGIVTIATLPLVAYYFNQIPWLGVFTNLMAVPITGAGLVPLGLGAGVWQLMTDGTHLPMAGVMQWLFDGFVSAIRVSATIPGAEWHVAAPALATMAMFYACFGMTVWIRDGRFIRVVAIGGVAVILLWWVWSPRLWLDGDRFRVTFLDVGQGDSAVIELPDGQVIVIDGGATYERFDMGRGVVAPYLWNRGIRTVDHLIGTHPQLDHLGGLTWLIRHVPVTRYWGSGERRDEFFYQRFLDAVHEKGLVEQIPHEGQEIVSGGPCRLLVLNPATVQSIGANGATTRKSGSVLNNRSVVTRLDCGIHSFLFAADVERDALSRMRQQPLQRSVEVVKVPHHGAASSLDEEWLASSQPAYAVVSAGRHNPYGHPNPSVLQAYSRQGSKIMRTDEDGGVWISARWSTPTLSVRTTRDGMLQPTPLPSCLWSCERANWGRIWRRFVEE
jgi:competence protein ComEC